MGTSRFPPGGKPSPHLKGKWGINLSSKGVPFLTFPVDDATTVWALSYRSAQPRARIRGTEALHRRQELLDEVRQQGSHLQNPFHEIVEATDPRTLQVFSAAHKMPVSHAELLPRGNVVLIGDANHPVTPFSGSGANMALLDAVVLARQLVSCGSLMLRVGRGRGRRLTGASLRLRCFMRADSGFGLLGCCWVSWGYLLSI
jgi:2-polyprenyl-6-methoxyphenol hydroxylase-like FAD-dependent oxidoreductase